MKLNIPVAGTVVAVVAEPYSFKEPDTGREVAGISRTIWVAPSFDSEPIPVKVKQDQVVVFDQVQNAGPGAAIALEARFGAYNGRESLSLIKFGSVQPAKR